MNKQKPNGLLLFSITLRRINSLKILKIPHASMKQNINLPFARSLSPSCTAPLYTSLDSHLPSFDEFLFLSSLRLYCHRKCRFVMIRSTYCLAKLHGAHEIINKMESGETGHKILFLLVPLSNNSSNSTQ